MSPTVSILVTVDTVPTSECAGLQLVVTTGWPRLYVEVAPRGPTGRVIEICRCLGPGPCYYRNAQTIFVRAAAASRSATLEIGRWVLNARDLVYQSYRALPKMALFNTPLQLLS